MESEEIVLKLQHVTDKADGLTHRVDDLEKETEILNKLATSMEVMVIKQDQVADTVNKLDSKVTSLEQEPANRWKFVVEKTIYIVVATVVGYILAKVGLS